MKLVKYIGQSPECIEGFPEDTERSKEGALYLRPGQTKQLTDDEYAYIKAHRKDLSKDVIVLREMGEPKKEEIKEEQSEMVENSEDDLAEE